MNTGFSPQKKGDSRSMIYGEIGPGSLADTLRTRRP